MSEYIQWKLNATAYEKALKNIEFKNLHTVFSDAIKKSLEIIRGEAKNQLGYKVPNLSKYADTIAAEVAYDAQEGRVKIIKGKEPMYPCKDEPYWKLHFFEKGTKPRKKKVDGYHWETSSNGIGARKHRNRGASTGRIQPQNFLSNAVSIKMNESYEKLRQNLNNSIERAFNR